MELITIIGVNVSTYTSHTYKTIGLDSNKIAHDETGKGITEPREFTKYIVYILYKNKYYFEIHLSAHHGASSDGRLYTLGYMHIQPSNCEESVSNSTHIPLKKLAIMGLGFKKCEDSVFVSEDNVFVIEDNVFVSSYNEPETCVFKFSHCDNDERTPCGYAYVNMELFQPKNV